MSPRISIIIPVYNVEAYLTDCLESVLRQDFEEMEILCVDDCSTDGSRAILEQYAVKDTRIRIISYAKRSGPSYARNRAMERASGEYIFFLDSDDMMTEGALRALYERASSERLDALCFDAENIYEDEIDVSKIPPCGRHFGRYDGVYTGQALFTSQMKQHDWLPVVWAYLWRTAFLHEKGLWFHEGILYEDNPFTFQAMMLAERMAVDVHPYYTYRRRKNSITTTTCAISEVQLTGWIAGIDDVNRMLEVLPIEQASHEWLQEAWRYLHGQEIETRRKLLKYHRAHPQELVFEQPRWNLVYQKLLAGHYQFVHGFLDNATLEKLEAAELIVIYGAGNIGAEVLCLIEEYGFYKTALAVTKKKDGQMYGLLRWAKELCEFQSFCKTALVIVATGRRLHEEMETEAKQQGFQHVVWYAEDF